MKRFVIGLGALTLLIGSVGQTWAAPMFVNGSFEVADGNEDWSIYPAFKPNINIIPPPPFGWVVGPPIPDLGPHPEGRWNDPAPPLGHPAGPTPFGNQWVVLGPASQGGYYIEQTVSGFTVGDTYTLSFYIASETYPGFNIGGDETPEDVAHVEVQFISGSSTPSQDFGAPPATQFQGWDVWGQVTMDFVATSPDPLATTTAVTIRFLDIGSETAFNDIGLDNVSILNSAVPEPASIVLLGLGALGLLGYTWRKRKLLVA